MTAIVYGVVAGVAVSILVLGTDSPAAEGRAGSASGAVLERMLQFCDDEPGMRFPLNYRTLT